IETNNDVYETIGTGIGGDLAALRRAHPETPWPRGAPLRRALYSNLRQRQPHLKAGFAGLRLEADFPVVFSDDAVDRVQPQSGAFALRFRGEKGVEDAPLDFRRNARPVVNDLDQNVVRFGRGMNPQVSPAVHGVDGVVDQVRPDLIERAAEGVNARQ